jgi:hypothetical protein
MADINPIRRGNSIIPPLPQDKTVDERERRKQNGRKKNQDKDVEHDNSYHTDGIDYYA